MRTINLEIEKVNHKMIDMIKNNQAFQSPVGLNGMMGLCMYFYQMSRKMENSQYEDTADKICDFVSATINKSISLHIENGLTGIGLGLIKLIKEEYVEGNINEILEEIDVLVYKTIFFDEDKIIDLQLTTELLYYCCVRYKEQKVGSEGEFIFRNLIFRMLNSYDFLSEENFNEPSSFSLHFHLPFFLRVMGLIVNLEPFRQKVKKIAEDMTNQIISKIPVLHAHRLYMIWSMIELTKNIELPAWEKHLRLLKNEIDVHKIIEHEILPDNIFFIDGFTGILYLLTEYNKMVSEIDKISFDVSVFFNKISDSFTWRKLLFDEKFLTDNMGMNGFCGTALVLINNLKNE